MRSPASAAAAPAPRAATPPPKFIRPKFERMPVELKQLKNWVLLVPIRKDRSGQNAESSRRDSAQAGATAAAITSASVRRSDVMHSRATDRRSASNCQGKWPDQTLDQAFGLPEVLVAVSTSRLSCKRAGKTRTLMPVGIHLENLGLNHQRLGQSPVGDLEEEVIACPIQHGVVHDAGFLARQEGIRYRQHRLQGELAEPVACPRGRPGPGLFPQTTHQAESLRAGEGWRSGSDHRGRYSRFAAPVARDGEVRP